MTARAFLVRGLLAGLLAGLVTFAVAWTVGEPSVERAIALETSAESTHTHSHDSEETAGAAATEEHSHSHGEDALVPRSVQSTVGLGLATVCAGLALGGLVAIAAAASAGRTGSLTPAQSTAVVSLVGFVAFALVPFWRYPANPPAVGSGDTIGIRTAGYFGFAGISLVAAVAAVVLAVRLARRHGAFAAVVACTLGYLAVVVAVGAVMPTVDEVGDFPASTLWEFRTASLVTLATLWAVLGTALTGAVGALHRQASGTAARRELAAGL
ncbi:CbtA family protein [Nocardioides bruguierae]|uniref:CbtA family protein n=1 Tax=Nocardioides bruguierae TaxID=2945102 RepID=A0A9X2D9N0_9ACTN|nr:CbtA family protein [Nocardioides bruguierae]MCM0621347.1 CbtA family protein [Nocardioides bruguierae]